MQLAIFDIDGTLTATSKVDADCYVQAVKDVFSIDVDGSDWSQFRHYTDSGIFSDVFKQARGRRPTVEEDKLVQKRFLNLMREAFNTSPELFAEVPGAIKMLQQLRLTENWVVALATGCWRLSAEMKLDCAGFEWAALPLATCDGFYRREDIMRDSLKQALQTYAVEQFEKIVYIGDGIWDVRGSRNLGFGFVGIQHENHDSKLAEEGAGQIIPNYQDINGFLMALEKAGPPGLPSAHSSVK